MINDLKTDIIVATISMNWTLQLSFTNNSVIGSVSDSNNTLGSYNLTNDSDRIYMDDFVTLVSTKATEKAKEFLRHGFPLPDLGGFYFSVVKLSPLA